MLSRKTPMKRTPFRKRAPKKRAGHDTKMRNACRGQDCWLRIPGVCHGITEDPSVVPCHANWQEYGKGGGLKAKDEFTVPGCGLCHYWLDFGRSNYEDKKAAWERAYELWSAYRDSAC